MFDPVYNTVKPLNSGHLRALKKFSVTGSCPLFGGNLTKIVTFGTKQFVRYSRHVSYWRCPLLGGFTVFWNQVQEIKFVFRTSGCITFYGCVTSTVFRRFLKIIGLVYCQLLFT